jgi:protein MpaA
METAPSIPSSLSPDPLEGLSVEGRKLTCSIHGYGAETVLFIGGIHGDEPAGTVLLEAFSKYLDVHPTEIKGMRVVIAPAVNPDGLARHERTNARGVDLNRNYATRNRKKRTGHGKAPLSEPESRYIAGLIDRFQPTRVMSIHQPIRCVDWDGQAEPLARAVADACNLPLKKLGARPGSLGSYAGLELGLPILTVELAGQDSALDSDVLLDRYREALLCFIHYPSLQE